MTERMVLVTGDSQRVRLIVRIQAQLRREAISFSQPTIEHVLDIRDRCVEKLARHG